MLFYLIFFNSGITFVIETYVSSQVTVPDNRFFKQLYNVTLDRWIYKTVSGTNLQNIIV